MQNNNLQITPDEARAELARRGINVDAIKDAYIPATTTATTKPTLLHSIVQSPYVQYILGSQYGTVSPFIREPQYGGGAAFEAGKPLGGALSILGLTALGMGAGASPAVANILAPTLYGGLTGGTHGALIGASAGLLGEGIAGMPGAGAAIEATKFIRPKAVVNAIQEALSPEKIKQKIQEGSAMYDDVFGRKIESKDLYHKDFTSIPSKITDLGFNTYRDLDKTEMKRAFSGSTKVMADNFDDNPTIMNAHKLQSSLQDRISKLTEMKIRNAGLPSKENTELYSNMLARQLLKNDMQNSLASINPELASKYNQASLNWATEVEPYKTAALINKNIIGKKTPERVLSNYEKYVTKKTPITEDLSLNAIVNKDPDEIAAGILPNEIVGRLNSLSRSLRNRNLLQSGLAGAAGYTLGGGHLIGDISSAIVGGTAPKFLRLLAQRYRPSIFETAIQRTRTPLLSPIARQEMRRMLARLILPYLTGGQ